MLSLQLQWVHPRALGLAFGATFSTTHCSQISADFFDAIVIFLAKLWQLSANKNFEGKSTTKVFFRTLKGQLTEFLFMGSATRVWEMVVPKKVIESNLGSFNRPNIKQQKEMQLGKKSCRRRAAMPLYLGQEGGNALPWSLLRPLSFWYFSHKSH